MDGRCAASPCGLPYAGLFEMLFVLYLRQAEGAAARLQTELQRRSYGSFEETDARVGRRHGGGDIKRDGRLARNC